MSEVAERTDTETQPPTPYDMIGGEPGLRRLVEAFYRIMDTAPEAAGIRAMHKADLGPVSESLFEWLSGWLGGPPLYIQRRGTPCLTGPHRPFQIDESARDQWMWCMHRALDAGDLTPDFRAALENALTRLASMVRNA